MQVALSYVSAAKARKNLEAEIPGWDFDAVRTAGPRSWNRRTAPIMVSGGTES